MRYLRPIATLVLLILVAACTADPVDIATTSSPTSTSTTTAPSTTTTAPTTTTSPSTTTTTPATTTTTAPPAPTTTAPPQPTTTRAPGTTSTTEPLPEHCRPQMFTAELAAQLSRDYPGQRITAHVYDTRTGCSYSLNPGNRQNTASVFKVMVMAGTLLEAQNGGRPVTDWEMAQMIPMITESTNSEVRYLWSHFGGSPWFQVQRDIFGLSQTTVAADDGSAWGNTRTSARDQVNLLRQILLGHWGPLEPGYRSVALDLMTSVVPSQTWGVTAGVPDGWRVAMKNGFAGSVINSVGWVDEPGSSDGYVVAILSLGWPSHPAGIAAVERVSRVIAEVMTDPGWTPP